MSATHTLGALALALLVGSAVLACKGPATKVPVNHAKAEPYVPLPDPEPDPLGYFLTRFDASLQQWSELKLVAGNLREQSTLQALEQSMRDRAQERRDELVATLETGAPLNRRIAAAALGFTKDQTVLGPLLAALDEPDPELVQKALLGIGVLALPETPPEALRRPLLDAPNEWTRNNAAFALLAVVSAGASSPELARICRSGLIDPAPGVRAQCASALGVLADAEAVPALSGLLQDEANLVALAASVSLARIGQEHPEQKGTAARALAAALEPARAERRAQILGALRWLARTDYGENARPWLEWAHKMP
ncbi:MAG TPA: HEAT repeat domain-containing protein [Planctomycetota bacterium]